MAKLVNIPSLKIKNYNAILKKLMFYITFVQAPKHGKKNSFKQ